VSCVSDDRGSTTKRERAMLSSGSLDATSGTARGRSFAVVIGKVTAIDWVSQIERELHLQLSNCREHVRVMRLVDRLRLEFNGRVFAVLRADHDGLLFRHWFAGGGYQEFCKISLDRARTLVRHSISEAKREHGHPTAWR
jgi:hypothetical protein